MHPNSDPLNDATFAGILVAAREGERRAAEALFRDLQPRILRFLRSTEPRAADDLAGEIWLAMAKGIHSFEGDVADFRAWVFGIARRRLADYRRVAVRRATDVRDVGSFADLPDPSDTADLAIESLSAQDAINLINATLPPDHAEVLTLRIVADLDVAHVAEVMGRSSNWVRVTQHRALRHLAATLAARRAAAEISSEV